MCYVIFFETQKSAKLGFNVTLALCQGYDSFDGDDSLAQLSNFDGSRNKENLKKGILQILVKEDFWQKNKFATKVLGQMLPIRLTDNDVTKLSETFYVVQSLVFTLGGILFDKK